MTKDVSGSHTFELSCKAFASLVSADESLFARCDICRRFAVPGQFFCTEHLTPEHEGVS